MRTIHRYIAECKKAYRHAGEMVIRIKRADVEALPQSWGWPGEGPKTGARRQ